MSLHKKTPDKYREFFLSIDRKTIPMHDHAHKHVLVFAEYLKALHWP